MVEFLFLVDGTEKLVYCRRLHGGATEPSPSEAESLRQKVVRKCWKTGQKFSEMYRESRFTLHAMKCWSGKIVGLVMREDGKKRDAAEFLEQVDCLAEFISFDKKEKVSKFEDLLKELVLHFWKGKRITEKSLHSSGSLVSLTAYKSLDASKSSASPQKAEEAETGKSISTIEAPDQANSLKIVSDFGSKGEAKSQKPLSQNSKYDNWIYLTVGLILLSMALVAVYLCKVPVFESR